MKKSMKTEPKRNRHISDLSLEQQNENKIKRHSLKNRKISTTSRPTLNCDLENNKIEESFTVIETKKKHKKKVPIYVKSESIQERDNESNLKRNSLDSQKKKKANYNNMDTDEKSERKISLNWESNKEYKPGMLSEFLQIKKYGRLLVPYDPSFGLDPMYKLPDNSSIDGSDSIPKVNINPLFDLSKRNFDTPTPQTDSSSSNVFVGNLPSDTTVISLKKLFRKCGSIHKVKLRCKERRGSEKVTNNTGGIKHVTAIIKFTTVESCNKALKLNGKLYKGCHIRVSDSRDEGNLETSRSVFVGNLAFIAQDEDLWTAFENCGPIETVRVIRDGQSGKGKGFGYVNFKSEDAVEQALKLDGRPVLGRNIRVSRTDKNVHSLSNSITAKKKINKKKKVNKPISCDNNFTKKSQSVKNDLGGEKGVIKKIKVKRKTIEESQESKKLKKEETKKKKKKKKQKQETLAD